MSQNALAFIFENSNKQTISVLIGALETHPRFDDLDIHLLRPRASLSRLHRKPLLTIRPNPRPNPRPPRSPTLQWN